MCPWRKLLWFALGSTKNKTKENTIWFERNIIWFDRNNNLVRSKQTIGTIVERSNKARRYPQHTARLPRTRWGSQANCPWCWVGLVPHLATQPPARWPRHRSKFKLRKSWQPHKTHPPPEVISTTRTWEQDQAKGEESNGFPCPRPRVSSDTDGLGMVWSEARDQNGRNGLKRSPRSPHKTTAQGPRKTSAQGPRTRPAHKPSHKPFRSRGGGMRAQGFFFQ